MHLPDQGAQGSTCRAVARPPALGGPDLDRRRAALRLAALGLLAHSGPGRATGGAALPADALNGVYLLSPVLLRQAALPDEALLATPGLDGLYLNLSWQQLEPAEGQYQFDLMLAAASRAVAHGLKLSLGVRAGAQAPAWLLARVARAEVVAGPHHGAARCEHLTVPWPWDPLYLQRHARLMQALAGTLQARPPLWAALRLVKVTGINQQTQETRLPSTEPAATGAHASGCPVSDSAALARQAGYSTARVLAAFASLADATAQAFPGKLLGMDVLGGHDFPLVDEQAAQTVPRMLDHALSRWPGRFAVQWDGLTAGPPPAVVLEAGRRGALIGWQTNMFRGQDGAGCGVEVQAFAQAHACSLAEYQAVLDNGLRHGARYLELMPADVRRLPQAVGQASRALAPARPSSPVPSSAS